MDHAGDDGHSWTTPQAAWPGVTPWACSPRRSVISPVWLQP